MIATTRNQEERVVSKLLTATTGVWPCGVLTPILAEATTLVDARTDCNAIAPSMSDLEEGLDAHDEPDHGHQCAGKIRHLAGEIAESAFAKAFANLLRAPSRYDSHAYHGDGQAEAEAGDHGGAQRKPL